MKRILFLIIALTVFVSCRSTVLNKMSLPELDVLDGDLDSYQLISYKKPGSDEVLSCEGSVLYDGSVLDIFIFAPTGQTIARISYNGTTVTTESSLIDQKAAPYIITDIMLVYGSNDKIKQYLDSNGYELSIKENSENKTRTIKRNGQIIYTITYCGNITTIDNLYRHYSYCIEEL